MKKIDFFANNCIQPIARFNSDDKQKPIFCFEIISSQSNNKEINLVKQEARQSKELLEKINLLSSLTWEDITKESRKTNGFEYIPIKQLKGCEWLKKLFRSRNDDRIIVFRVKANTKSRLLGFREGRVFKICCYDHDGTLYDH